MVWVIEIPPSNNIALEIWNGIFGIRIVSANQHVVESYLVASRPKKGILEDLPDAFHLTLEKPWKEVHSSCSW